MTATVLACVLVVALGSAARLRPAGRTVRPEIATPCTLHPLRRPIRAIRTFVRRSDECATAADIARWCDDIARGTRAGLSLGGAIVDATPPAGVPDVGHLVLRLARGEPVERATAGVTERLDRGPADGTASSLALAFTVLQACARHGGPPSEPLSRAAAVLRGRANDDAERRVQSAQARLSALVMTVLPLAMLTLLLVTSGSIRAVVTGRSGLLIIASGIALNLIGWRWMRSIIERRAV